MLISGVNVPLANLARLAIRSRHLGETELSVRISLAIDMNRSELKLDAFQRATLLAVLGDGPDVFDELRAALKQASANRSASTRREDVPRIP
jgi:hypothetical protein